MSEEDNETIEAAAKEALDALNIRAAEYLGAKMATGLSTGLWIFPSGVLPPGVHGKFSVDRMEFTSSRMWAHLGVDALGPERLFSFLLTLARDGKMKLIEMDLTSNDDTIWSGLVWNYLNSTPYQITQAWVKEMKNHKTEPKSTGVPGSPKKASPNAEQPEIKRMGRQQPRLKSIKVKGVIGGYIIETSLDARNSDDHIYAYSLDEYDAFKKHLDFLFKPPGAAK